MLPTLGGLAVDVADQARLGMASGVNNTVMQIGSAVGIAAYGVVLSRHRTYLDGLDALFATASAVAFCGAAPTLPLLSRKRS